MNVFEAMRERIKFAFDNFDYICVSFSGGKDSGVMLNAVMDYAKEIDYQKKIGVFHIDYEAQYQMTTDYVIDTYAELSDRIDNYHVCLPVAAQCATSMTQSYWLPWDNDKKSIWVRDMPENCINEQNCPFDFFEKGMWDYELQEKFGSWLAKEKGSVCCFVGIRTQESLNRWRAIHSDSRRHSFEDKPYTKKVADSVFNVYPIYDFTTEDIWTANGKNNWSYNALYDIFWQAGLSIDEMRVASPFNDCAIGSLKLYKAIDPNSWGKMIGRVNGVNFSAIYGGTTAMGWKNIKLPSGHTWKSYMEFLLSTLPEEAKDNYGKKLEKSKAFWIEKGGVLDDLTIKELLAEGVELTVAGKTNYNTEKQAVRMAYQDDTSATNFKQVPTYKRMCICIMKNDHLCKYMGFSLTKTEMKKRSEAESKFKNIAA
jgi:predicted phosphoadenosine phosphosulfate sulfurtransferase